MFRENQHVSEMAAARFNVYWFLSFLVPAAIMLAVTYWKSRKVFFLGVLVSLALTYWLCNIAVQEKWRTRFEMAKTEQQIQVATTDGANIVFTAFFFGPLEAVLYTWFWGYIGRKAWPALRKQKLKIET